MEKLRALERRAARMKRAAVWIGGLAVVGVLVAAWQWQRAADLKAQELAREQGRAKAQEREKILAKARALGGDERAAGWTTNVLAKVREAVRLQTGDDARDVAAVTLAGREAKLTWWESNAAASSLAWDQEGRKLLIGGYADTRVQTPTRILDTQDRTCIPVSTTGAGPVSWNGSGSPLQFRIGRDREDNLHLYVKRPLDDVRLSLTNFGKLQVLSDEVAACSADGSRAACSFVYRFAGDTNARFGTWVFETKTRRLLSETNLWATALAFTPDGNLLAAGFRDGRITVYGLPGLTEVAAFQIEDNAITSLAFQRDLVRRTNAVPNSTWRLAAGDRGSFIFVWELAKGGTIARLRGSNFDAQALAFNPDGTLLSLPCPETKAAEDCRSP